MTYDEIEFLISQHFDGTLSVEEAGKLRAALESDPSAHALFEEHARLDAALKSTKAAPDIDQEWFSAEIVGKIDEAQSRPLRISNWNIFAPMAVAAALLFGLTLGVVLFTGRAPAGDGPALARVSLPSPPRPAGETVSRVSVGVPANLSPAMMTTLFLAEHRGSGRVEIHPVGEPRHDPFD